MNNHLAKQQGIGIVSLIILLAMGGFVVVMALKVVPQYLEYWSIRKVLNAMAQSGELQSASVNELRAGFDRRAQIDDIKVIKGTDLDISKDGGQAVVTASYAVKVPLVANVSACIDFSASTGATK